MNPWCKSTPLWRHLPLKSLLNISMEINPWQRTTPILKPHLSHNLEGCWGTTDDLTTSFLHSVLLCPLGLGELRACPFPDAVFPPLLLSALSSSPFYCALQDGFWPDLMNRRHVHTTAVYILRPLSLRICPSYFHVNEPLTKGHQSLKTTFAGFLRRS